MKERLPPWALAYWPVLQKGDVIFGILLILAGAFVPLVVETSRPEAIGTGVVLESYENTTIVRMSDGVHVQANDGETRRDQVGETVTLYAGVMSSPRSDDSVYGVYLGVFMYYVGLFIAGFFLVLILCAVAALHEVWAKRQAA